MCRECTDAGLPMSALEQACETIANAVERYRHRLRELAADLHRVRSSPWPSSLAKAAAKELIDRVADAGMPNLDDSDAETLRHYIGLRQTREMSPERAQKLREHATKGLLGRFHRLKSNRVENSGGEVEGHKSFSLAPFLLALPAHRRKLLDPDQRCRSTAAKSGAWQQDGLPTSKLPGSPLSFSSWRCSPSSCCPLGERGRQDEQITGNSMKAGVQG